METTGQPSTASPSRTIAKKRRRRYSIVVLCLTVPIVAICAFWLFGFHFYTVVSNSMSPTLLAVDGLRFDKLLCSLVAFKNRAPRRWEIVVFHTPTKKNVDVVANGGRLPVNYDMTVKRAVGLPGEEIAIRAGDVWTRPAGSGMFTLQAKPDRTQRSVWISVYDEDFSLAGVREFLHFWRLDGDGTAVAGELGGVRHLRFFPENESLRLHYLPTVRVGPDGGETALLPGIPDRSLLPQTLWFACPDPDCGAVSPIWHNGGQVQAPCPSCGRFLFEEDVQIYGHNSGLTLVGPDGAQDINNIDMKATRITPYRLVTDLRLQASVMLTSPGDTLSLTLAANGTEDTLECAPNRLSLNGIPLKTDERLTTDTWLAVEFHRADGMLKLFIDNQEIPLPHTRLPAFPEHNRENDASGASLSVTGNGVHLKRIALDRDIHYTSDFGLTFALQFNSMGNKGRITLSPTHFFPLGDNNELSLDARIWGPVPLTLLRGNAIAITQPLERRRLIPVPRE